MLNKFSNLKEFIQNNKRRLSLSGLAILAIALPVTILLTQQQQDLRQRAFVNSDSNSTGSQSVIPETATKNANVLVLSYYPRDPRNRRNLDPNATGESTSISSKQTYVNSLISQLTTNLSKGSAYHQYKNSNSQPYLKYTVLQKKDIYTKIPRGHLLKSDEGVYRPNYGKIVKDQNICDLVDNKGVTEVWMFGYHFGDIEPDESRMSSKYGDISNSGPKENDPNYLPEYRLPICKNAYVLYNYNYQRSGLEMVHNRIHQLENVMYYVDKTLFWGDFSEYIQAPGGCAGALAQDPDRPCKEPPHTYMSSCGNSHYAPNWQSMSDEYIYNKTNYAMNNCETWHPDESKTTYVSANCNQWGCSELGYYNWFMQNVPGYNSCITHNGLNMRNWWDGIYDFNEFIDKGKSLYSTESNCSTLTTLPKLTTVPTKVPTAIPTKPFTTPTPTPTPAIIPTGTSSVGGVSSVTLNAESCATGQFGSGNYRCASSSTTRNFSSGCKTAASFVAEANAKCGVSASTPAPTAKPLPTSTPRANTVTADCLTNYRSVNYFCRVGSNCESGEIRNSGGSRECTSQLGQTGSCCRKR